MNLESCVYTDVGDTSVCMSLSKFSILFFFFNALGESSIFIDPELSKYLRYLLIDGCKTCGQIPTVLKLLVRFLSLV